MVVGSSHRPTQAPRSVRGRAPVGLDVEADGRSGTWMIYLRAYRTRVQKRRRDQPPQRVQIGADGAGTTNRHQYRTTAAWRRSDVKFGAQQGVGDPGEVTLGVGRRHPDDDVSGAGIDVARKPGGDLGGRADDEGLDG
jgi:hypothetical protein